MVEKENNVKDFKNEPKEPKFVNYLMGFAILLLVFIIGYNAFVNSDTDLSVHDEIDTLDRIFDKKERAENSSKININYAGKEDLKKIKGIGDQVAEEIINYRETHGGFSSKNELLNVSGIGERTFEKIKDQITL